MTSAKLLFFNIFFQNMSAYNIKQQARHATYLKKVVNGGAASPHHPSVSSRHRQVVLDRCTFTPYKQNFDSKTIFRSESEVKCNISVYINSL